MIKDDTIVNADVNASAAIAGTKVSPDFGSQTITTSGVISPALGTAALPSIAFTGDPNTGIFSPSADTIAFSTAGTERMRIRSDGNVAIGASGRTDATLSNQGPITGGTVAYGNFIVATVQSDVTATAYAHRTLVNTQATAFTVSTLAHYAA
jgi:hypothetical protein